jgi:hypothetical protein
VDEPPNNRFKLPSFIVLAAFAVVFLATGKYVSGAFILILSVHAIVAILRGRNPWQIRSPLDRHKPPDPN